MYAFAFFPRSVPCATLCRKMLPVEMCGTPRYAVSLAAWVPLPAPGGPRRTSLMSRRERSQRSKDFGLGVHPRLGHHLGGGGPEPAGHLVLIGLFSKAVRVQQLRSQPRFRR